MQFHTTGHLGSFKCFPVTNNYELITIVPTSLCAFTRTGNKTLEMGVCIKNLLIMPNSLPKILYQF